MCAKHFRMVKEPGHIRAEGETDTYVHSYVTESNKGKLIDSVEKCETLYEALKMVAESHGNYNYLGRIDQNEQVEYITYKEARMYAETVAKFILAHSDIKDQDKKPIVGICSENRPEWVIVEHSTYFFGGINCPIYASFGWSATKHIFNETKMNMLFVSVKNADKIANSLRNEDLSKVSIPRILVLMDSNVSEGTCEVFKSSGIDLYYFWDIVKRCKRLRDHSQEENTTAKKKEKEKDKDKTEPHTAEGIRSIFKKPKECPKELIDKHFAAPTGTTIATICYTSGTTGAPKGAMLMHKNFLSVIGAFLLLSKKGVFFDIKDGNRYLSFLPLAHVFERIVESALLLSKCRVVYYRGNPKQLQKDISIAKPHYFVGVPRVFNSVKVAIETKAREKGRIANFIFTYSLLVCMVLKNRFIREIFGKTVFRTIRETFGGSITCMLSGSAPLSGSCALFFEAIFNCPMFEGYGQTETTAGNITTDAFTNEKGVIGIPFPCNRIKLVSRPESNAFAEKNQGEILMQGGSVFYGYYNQDRLTKDCFYTEDGQDTSSESIYNETGMKWVKTGDIGEITAEGNLRIIGRSKEIFKLSQGEYIIPEKIENNIQATKITDLDDITIVGDSTKDYVIGICSVSKITEEVQKRIEDAIAQRGAELVQAGELIKIEIPRKLLFTTTVPTIENDLLTPSGKKIRKKILGLFDKEIQKLYNTI